MVKQETMESSDVEKQLHIPMVAFTGLILSVSCLVVYNLLLSLYSQLFSLVCLIILSYIVSKKLSETDILYRQKPSRSK